MRTIRLSICAILFGAVCAVFPDGAVAQLDKDQTLRAMRDEMARAKTRLELMIPGTDQPVRPYYIEYRLLDLNVREVVAEFGALLTSIHTQNRFMNVVARVGTYKLDSSNFVGEESFRGFIGPTGSVGIDRDYDSLRQDLWIATDQAFKEAVETYSRKQAYLSSLARQSDIDDFTRIEPTQFAEPLETPDWTSRNWDQEARQVSAELRAFSDIRESRVTYYLVYATEYLLTSEGTEIRQNRHFAAIEAGMNSLADDGVPLNHLYSNYASRPEDLPNVDSVRKGLHGSSRLTERAGLHRPRTFRATCFRFSSRPSARTGGEWRASANLFQSRHGADAERFRREERLDGENWLPGLAPQRDPC
jgi:TldD protein